MCTVHQDIPGEGTEGRIDGGGVELDETACEELGEGTEGKD